MPVSVPVEHIVCAYYCRRMYTQNNAVRLYKKRNMVAFKGTDSFEKLTYSFNMSKTNNIHKGYKEYAEYCKDHINFNELDSTRPIKFTAHSLGSVAATIIASEVDTPIELILFGSPKPGGVDFIKRFRDKKNVIVHNYITQYDPVQVFPFIADYEHVEEPEILLDVRYQNILKNHSMDCYIENLKNNMDI